MTYYSALHYATKAEKSASEAALHNLKNKITNCITEIPQDIKLELVDGTLVLKAGSKVYVPNGKNADGSNKFDVVTIASDLTTTDTGNRTLWFTYDMTANKLTAGVSSETGAPVSGTYKMYYDSSENKCFVSYASSYKQTSFPICIIKSSTTGITSIDQVFNGFGYIGKRNYILPNVKLLISKGYNKDGSHKNQEYIVNNVLISNNDFSANSIMFFRNNNVHQIYNINKSAYLGELSSTPAVGTGFQWYYNTTERLWYMHEAHETSWKQRDYANLGTNTANETSFKEVFRAVDYNDLSDVINDLTKHVVVTSLPSTKDADTFYYIPE
jgi:hypothetical protein